MEANRQGYSFLDSFSRIDTILAESDTSFEELDNIPSRSKLTYTNGFYVNCVALFVDIRDSSELPSKHKRPTLAKLYRTYLSEVVAVMNGNLCCAEINIEGDCVSGIYEAPYTASIESAFSDAAIINSLVKVLNYKLEQNSITPIKVGIGLAYGRALMIKAGYSGSGLNDVVWMGDVVNEASKLCNMANKNSDPIFVSKLIFHNLSEESKSFLSNDLWVTDYYHGNVINLAMEEWYKNNCQSRKSWWG
jgi:class 3 adenylate cyclase